MASVIAPVVAVVARAPGADYDMHARVDGHGATET
jgi:hypothetical protein